MVTSLLRLTARAVFNLKENDSELDRWSPHSLRITACNLLHRQHFSDSFIQNRLRWKSDAFKMYLRNTFYSATQHSAALTITDDNLPPAHQCTYRALEPHEKCITTTESYAHLWPVEI